MRISYWSSDVCSSDLRLRARAVEKLTAAYRALGSEAEYDAGRELETAIDEATASATQLGTALGIGPVTEVVASSAKFIGGQLAENAHQRRLVRENGRASWRERVCQYV